MGKQPDRYVRPRERDDCSKQRQTPEGEADLTLRNIFVVPDLTPMQREEQKELRRKRKEMLAELEQKGEIETTVIIRRGRLLKEKERHGPAGPRREGGRENANAQPQSTRTSSSLCSVCTNIDSFINKREEFLIRIADSSPEFTVEPIVL